VDAPGATGRVPGARLFAVLVLQDLRLRFAGSRLGILWLVLQPILYLTMTVVVFFGVLRVRFGGQGLEGYALALLAGLSAWLGCNEALSRAAGSLVERALLLRNYPVPRVLVPLVPLAGALAYETVCLALVVLLAASRGALSAQLPLLAVGLVLQVLLLAGLAWIVAALAALYRDAHYLLAFVLMVWLYVTPIFYPADAVPQRLAPLLVYLNPLSLLVVIFRAGVLGGEVGGGVWAVLAVQALSTAVVGYLFFRRIESALVDLL
jgi:lipopolysaccharide transport system permease protein